jgi:hypothetical protein
MHGSQSWRSGQITLIRMARKSAPAIALNLAFLFIVAWILLGYLRYAQVSPPSFDGATNLNTALSFIQGRGYGFFYDEFFPFPAQTDGPFTLPAGALMRLGGVTPLTTQGISLAYLVGTAVAGFLLFRKVTGSLTVALAGTAVLLMTPGLFPYSMGGYGEIPSVFWLLCSLNILASTLDAEPPSRLRLGLGGTALALCYLTKVVSLILVAPTIVLFTTAFVLRHSRNVGRIVWFFMGLALPILAWEAFRLVEIGAMRGYLEWWKLQFGQALLQSGAAETLSQRYHGPIAKSLEHMQILGDQIGTPVSLLAIFLLVPWFVIPVVLVSRWRRRNFGTLFYLAVCWLVAILIFVWWLAIEATSQAWLRRIVDGLILQQILAVIALFALIDAFRRRGGYGVAQRALLAVPAIALAISEVFLLARGQTLSNPPTASAEGRDQIALARTIRDLPADATVFGFGWWKAPVLALFSGRPIMNFYSWDPEKIDALREKYLVVDSEARGLAGKDLEDILSTVHSNTVATGPGGAVYKIDNVVPYRPFSADDRDPAKLRAGFAVAAGAYPATRGVYAPEGPVEWVTPDAALLLLRKDQTHISLSVYIPDQLAPSEAGAPLLLHLESAGCLDQSIPIAPGAHQIVSPLTCAPSDAAKPLELSLHVNGHMPRPLQIDGDQRRLAFLLKDVRLTGP